MEDKNKMKMIEENIKEQIEKFNELTEQIKTHAVEQVSEDFELAKFREKVDKLERDVAEIRNKFSSLYDDLGFLFMRILGQMYNGVLIKGRVSIRKGNIYPYQCQYKISINSLKDYLNQNLTELESKLGKERFNVVVEMLKRLVDTTTEHNYSYRGSRYPMKEIIIKLEKPITPVEVRYKESFETKRVTHIRINPNGVNLLEEDENKRIEVTNTYFVTQIYFLYRDKIILALKEVNNFLNEEYKKSSVGLEEMKSLGGDYLILANLEEQRSIR